MGGPGRRALLGLGVAAALAAASPARGQDWLLVEGLAAGDAWDTSDGGQLGRNGGDPTASGELTLWAAAEAAPPLFFFVMAELEHDFESGGETADEIEQLFVRYTPPTRHPFSLEAGRITSPVGAFTRRHLAHLNPLIGSPYTYDVSYPEGVKAYGSVAWFDYQVAVVDRPMQSDYLPGASSALRPALAVGVTPFTGLRAGISYTEGPYLNDRLGVAITFPDRWHDFEQSILGFELHFSRGYLEVNSEYVLSGYDVPMEPRRSHGTSFYADVKYTWTPRLFTALRWGSYDSPYIRPEYMDYWATEGQRFTDAEIGAGYRLTRSTVLKASYRRDWMHGEGYGGSSLGESRAFAVQIAHRFDVTSWFDGPLP